MASKKQITVVLTPKTSKGKEMISYHTKWSLVEIAVPKLLRSKGECYMCRSRDGSKLLMVQVVDDPDIDARLIK